MAIGITARGTSNAKTAGRVLRVGAVSRNPGRTLVVGVAFDNSQGDPKVVFTSTASTVTLTRSGSVVTVTHTAHGLDGGRVVIDGANEAGYNGIHRITVTGVNTYTYTIPSTPTSPATGTISSYSVVGKDFRLVPDSKQANAGTGMTVGQWRRKMRKSGTREVIAVWNLNINARTMVVSEIQEASKKDVGQKKETDATTAPATGVAVTSTVADTISIAHFASKGPVSDTAGTAGVGHTLGQRDGTVGAPVTSNITIQETYEILSATGNIRATLTGATSRDWAATITAFGKQQSYTIDATEHFTWDAFAGQETVRFDIKDEAGTVVDQYQIAVEAYQQMSETQRRECLRYACQVLADKLDGPTDINPVDSDIEATAAVFVGETITV